MFGNALFLVLVACAVLSILLEDNNILICLAKRKRKGNGRGIILAIMESVYVMTGKQVYKDMVKFWGKLFGINKQVDTLKLIATKSHQVSEITRITA